MAEIHLMIADNVLDTADLILANDRIYASHWFYADKFRFMSKNIIIC